MATTSMRRADNLPAELSRIVGRRAESAAVRRLLSDSRLVTLTGVGGVGKTRLAVHVARQVRSAFPDGVCLVMLADLATPGLLPTAVMSAASRGLRAGAGIAELADELAERQLLLVLDNCEHLAAACADLVTTLLRRCPGLRVVTTSRERLRVEGEAVFAVPPLSVPAEGQHLELSDLTRYEALALFVERASAVHRDESSGDLDAESVATLCRRLDGLPLAIELMAGRAATLPVKTLTERADDRFRLLTGGSRSAAPRHQTLWAAVDYSYALCSEPARLLWSRMSSFVGGATLDSVRDVCADSALPAADVEAALTELVEKSVVVFNGHRYQMLETLREYGRERLHERVEEISIQVAHLDHFAGLAADPVSGACRPATKARMTSLLVEHANLRAALEFSLRDRAHRARGLRMASSLWQFWFGCGLQREGRHWLGELLTDFEEPCLERMTALWVDGFLAAVDGDHGHAVQRADQCADLAKRLGDQSGIAHATYVRALAILFRGQTNEALPMLEKAVGLLRTVPGSNPVLGASLLSLGIAACLANELELATAALTEGHDLSRASGEELQESWIRVWLGVPALLDGRHDEAVDTIQSGPGGQPVNRRHGGHELCSGVPGVGCDGCRRQRARRRTAGYQPSPGRAGGALGRCSGATALARSAGRGLGQPAGHSQLRRGRRAGTASIGPGRPGVRSRGVSLASQIARRPRHVTAHAQGARGRVVGRAGNVEQGDRRSARHLPAHRRDPRGAHPHQAGIQLEDTDRGDVRTGCPVAVSWISGPLAPSGLAITARRLCQQRTVAWR